MQAKQPVKECSLHYQLSKHCEIEPGTSCITDMFIAHPSIMPYGKLVGCLTYSTAHDIYIRVTRQISHITHELHASKSLKYIFIRVSL